MNSLSEQPAWDCISNADFRSDCILGFFRNHDPSDPSSLGEVFGMLTAVKSECFWEYRYEECFGRRWRHFRAATQVEVAIRIWEGQP